MEHTPDIDSLISCLHEGDRPNEREWLEKHMTQAGTDIDTDTVHTGVGEHRCVSYQLQTDLSVHIPDRSTAYTSLDREFETIASELVERLYEMTVGGVAFAPVVGCDPLFADKTDFPKFDNEIGDPYHMVYTQLCLPPTKFLQIQYQQVYPSDGSDSPSFSSWVSDTNPEQISVFQEAIEDRTTMTDEGFEIPRPFLVLDRDLRLEEFQEGRHRGVAALQAGVDMMDVYVFVDTRSDRGIPEHKFGVPPMLPNKFD